MADKPDTSRASLSFRNVISLPASADFSPIQALDSMKTVYGPNITDVLILAYVDGDLVIRSSKMSRADGLWMVEHAKKDILGELDE